MSKPTQASALVAAKVFAIPELLELILLGAVPEESDNDELSEPALILFRAFRVNQSFKATIEGSAKLQRLMWLQTANAPNQSIKRSASPALWLLAQLRMDLDTVDNGSMRRSQPERLTFYAEIALFDQDVEYEDTQYNALQEDYNTFKQRFGAPEASWRNMLVASGSACDSVAVQVTVHMGFCDEQRHPVFKDSVVISWEFVADEKIDAIWRQYSRLMEALKAKEEGILLMAARRWEAREQDKSRISDWTDDLE
ncbi:hypothetical protein CLAFUW4_07544 [Fulvia fulva]|uniref:Uncharacterized protein n=1 Tax=Passalora fulva TaxID=5499 RepID=A0A9Q8PB41_PASFU|nr:uncharacterized protein CLAFUR5_07675 [Fulvia fulva]KAK4621975.1 hypothetical protein CLAFUR4_07550 [Fulvia fulva]KAK4622612.1 hypothetical protein CLAFUR0_07549 [Fulvia fulva]UJO19185.1 hypothetical protein CLAFUR5_07675 [Fulvia fulva]WPV15685.1 hypothetical protein CLAFUW4_07544 [Fulvia fulva]WPV31081.1 hypothetical protein CLAFUW7_07546 [Fulvia fulva]